MPKLKFKQLVNTTGTSNKFWEAWIEEASGVWYFCARWGRIGTAGQSNKWPHNTRFRAQDQYNSKVFEKMSKGYTTNLLATKPETTYATTKAAISAAAKEVTGNAFAKVKPKPKPAPEPEVDDGFGFLDALSF